MKYLILKFSKFWPLPLVPLIIIFWQFPFHSRVGDDWPNSQLMKFSEWRYGQISPELFITITWNAITDWMNGQGRFFPVAGFQGQIVLFLFESDISLAVFYGFFLCLCLFLWYLVLNNTFNSVRIGNFFIILMLICLRFRSGFDPHIGFAQLVIWSYFWVTCSILVLVKNVKLNSHSRFKPWLAAILYFAALCQYELSILGFPVILIFVYISLLVRHDKSLVKVIKNVYPTIFVTFTYLILVFGYLRPRANPTGNYVVGFDVVESAKIFFNTVFAGLPLVGIDFNQLFLLPKGKFETALSIFLILLAYLFLGYKIEKSNKTKKVHIKTKIEWNLPISKYKFMAVITLSMLPLLFGPSMILALQPNWWGYFKFGNTYLGVYYSEIGIATIFSIIFSLREIGKNRE